MSDITKRLHNMALGLRDKPLKGYAPLVYEAATEIERLRDVLDTIRIYGSDTLSGRVGGPDDRKWQREGVREMTELARSGLPPTEDRFLGRCARCLSNALRDGGCISTHPDCLERKTREAQPKTSPIRDKETGG